MTKGVPRCHDYIEGNEISTPHTKKKDLEESGRHLAKGEPTCHRARAPTP